MTKKIIKVTIATLLLIGGFTFLAGCDTPRQTAQKLDVDWEVVGYYTKCDRRYVDGVDCVICKKDSSVSVDCNFN